MYLYYYILISFYLKRCSYRKYTLMWSNFDTFFPVSHRESNVNYSKYKVYDWGNITKCFLDPVSLIVIKYLFCISLMLGVVFYNSISMCNPQWGIYYFKFFSLCWKSFAILYISHTFLIKEGYTQQISVFKMKNLQ